MKKKITLIKNFVEGDLVRGFFLCTEKHLRYTKSGDLFIDIELRDMTGNISAKIWDNVGVLDKKFESGNAVVISGNIESYMGKLQLNIKKINKATVQYYGRYGFDPGLIVPKSKKDPHIMWKDIGIIINGINDKYCKVLLKQIFKKNKKKILYCPASLKMHYNYRSGYLEHLVMITRLTKKVSRLYSMDYDLIMTGVLLYDIGIIRSLDSNYKFDYTKEGRLIGHKVLGSNILKECVKEIKNFPQEMLLKLDHIILSNINEKKEEFRPPSFPEAVFVNMIILLDKKINIMKALIDQDQGFGDFTDKYNFFGFPVLKENN